MSSARRWRCLSARRLPEDWLAQLPGVLEDEPLAPHSWYGIGGRARYFTELSDDRDLHELVARLNAERQPYLVIGAATNTLFAAAELPGLTIKLATSRLEINDDTISVSSGYLMPRLAAEAARAGLEGRRIGGAQISAKHANFIVNLGGANADDVLALMAEMRQRVFERFGVELEPEIRVVGRTTAG